jgi:hypothetical protein
MRFEYDGKDEFVLSVCLQGEYEAPNRVARTMTTWPEGPCVTSSYGWIDSLLTDNQGDSERREADGTARCDRGWAAAVAKQECATLRLSGS